MKTIFTFLLFLASLAYAQGSEKALSFDGNDYVRASTDSYGITTQATISAWVRTPTTPAYRWIAGKYESSSDGGIFIHMRGSTGRLAVSGRNDNGTFFTTDSPTSYNDGLWHHVVGVHNNGLWQLYVDGILVDSRSTPAGNIDNVRNFEVGRYYLSGGQAYWNGNIDEVSLWNVALSQTQIREMMCQGLQGNEPGLVTYYKMDEGADNTCSGGQDVCDASASGNHGTKF